MRLECILLGGALVATAASAQTPLQAQEQTYGFNAIARNDLAAAEARLLAQKADEPSGAPALLNLAYVYTQTGRATQATELYTSVLSHENELLVTGSGQKQWSHDLARRGLDRARQMASR
jgi:hypothetical protein